MAWMDVALAILAAVEEAVEDVVLVRGDAEAGDGKSHAMGEPAGEDVAEVSGGHDELHVTALFDGEPQPRPDVINALREDAGDVDGIDGREVVRAGEGDV